MKKLSIILPFYGEDLETIEPMLSSINCQQFCTPSDYELILVDDCGPSNFTLDDIRKYLWKFDVKIIKMEKNGGPGNARQLGIDKSKAEYVIMGDCDDTFHNNLVFNFFENAVYKEQVDVAHTKWLQANYIPNIGHMMQEVGMEFTWFFGKFYKRSFLEKNNLREHPDLRVHEEIQIVRLAPHYTQNIKYYDYPTYIWSPSEGSITRKNDGEYGYTGNATYCYSNDLLLDRMIGINKGEALKQALGTMLLLWSSFQNNDENDITKPWFEQTEKMASYFINKWGPQLDELEKTDPNWQMIKLQEYKNMTMQLHRMPKENFEIWYDRIKALDIKELPEFKQPEITSTKKGR